MTKTVDFYFTVLSPYTYLALPRLAEIARRRGAAIAFKPMDIGKVFAAAGVAPPAQRSDTLKAYRAADLARVSATLGMPINLKPAFWPAPQQLASGLIVAAQNAGNDPMALVQAILGTVWVDEGNIADEPTLVGVASKCGYDGAGLLAEARSEAVQATFEANTAEAIGRGVFGSPSFVVDGGLFWGQDRLSYLDAAL